MSVANIVFTQLVVNGESYDPANHPEYLCANDALAFSAECRNDGDQTTRSFHVTFRLDNGVQHSEWVAGMSPGESRWSQWRYESLPDGWHEIYVEFDADERVRENDGNDNSYSYPFQVAPAQNVGHTLAFEAETITAHPNFVAQGWRQIDVTFVIRDARGTPIRGYNFFTKFLGPENEESDGGQDAGDSKLAGAGVLRCPNVWLKSEGTVHLAGLADANGPHAAGPMLEGVRQYRLADGATTMTFDVAQGHEEVTVTASSSREASEKVTAEGHAGITIEVLEVGGSVGSEHGSTHAEGRQLEYKVVLGTPELALTQTH